MDRGRLRAGTLAAVLAVEDAVHVLVVRIAAATGRREVAVLPFIGYGTPEVVRVRGRVVIGRSGTPSAAADLVSSDTQPEPPPAPGSARVAGRWGWVGRWRVAGWSGGVRAATGLMGRSESARTEVRRRWAGAAGRIERGRRTWGVLRASLAPFLTIELPGTAVLVSGPVGEVDGRCDRQGYLDVPVDGRGLAPGWHALRTAASWRGSVTEAELPVLVVDPAAELAVISDLDDTVIHTGITRGLEFLRLTLLTTVADRTPLPGAAALYQALTAPRGGPARPVFYLSNSPWNLYELLTRFLLLRGFPAGPLLLTDWGPSRTNLFRVGAEQHKLTLIRSLLAQHPGLRVVLVGDTGELDPEIYATVARESPDRVRAVYVRRTAGMPAARAVEVHGLVRRAAEAGVPMLMVEDSVQIAEHAAGLGLLDADDVRRVRRAS